ncbi:uracil-DNA glycosylase [Candidatus Clavichlamydia salmonicola]|uniref:uracil-DNA glycosylase n=1 Tax=Candidatus Clavichlamydia salmonicola TaxID=469812 RepID=UPI001891EAA2|nr:uracil-DNA glycosylase [Candidatus Clavichlamydia salmonicola]
MKTIPALHPSWGHLLEDEWKKPYMEALRNFIQEEREGSVPIYPRSDQVFTAFKWTPFDKVKVVIVGQDPYHGPDQAHGLSFSVPEGCPTPPSLKNVFKELESDLGIKNSFKNGCLRSWSGQGVFLLNTVLTVKQFQPRAHYGKGWEIFTDKVIQLLCEREEPVIFVLWGRAAYEKCKYIDTPEYSRHTVLTTSHPSPLSAYQGFFGCCHFSKINNILKKQNKVPINWKIP